LLNSLVYNLTILFPLKIRNFFLRILCFASRSSSPSLAFCKLFRGKFSIGLLPDGNILYFPLDDLKILEIINEVYAEKIYDAEKMGSFKRVLDVGSHIGLFTLRVSKIAPESRMTTIEANPANFYFLRKNISANRLFNRVRIVNVAAGELEGSATLYVGELSRGDCSIKKPQTRNLGEITIAVRPLDSILAENEEWDMIKLDVEGAEVEALKGLNRTLKRTRLIDMEVHSLLVKDSDVYDILSNAGFKIKVNRKLYEWCSFLEATRLLDSD
jgi:FkbM family methyltransferase